MKISGRAEILIPSQTGECSNGGISSKHKTVWITDDKTSPKEIDGMPVVIVEYRAHLKHWRAYDPSTPENSTDAMFGGCMIKQYSLSKITGQSAIDLHDRFETWAEYETYSK